MIFGGRARFTLVMPGISAPILHRFLTDRFPQLKGTKITHAWTGNVATKLLFISYSDDCDAHPVFDACEVLNCG